MGQQGDKNQEENSLTLSVCHVQHSARSFIFFTYYSHTVNFQLPSDDEDSHHEQNYSMNNNNYSMNKRPIVATNSKPY